MQIKKLDHLVLTVKSVEATCRFYTKVLGMPAVTFAGGRKAIVLDGFKINLHEAGREFEPKALRPTPGSADLCFVTDVPLPDIEKKLGQQGVEVLGDPVKRTGAEGPILSIYLRDPDGNLIEISNYIQRRRYP